MKKSVEERVEERETKWANDSAIESATNKVSDLNIASNKGEITDEDYLKIIRMYYEDSRRRNISEESTEIYKTAYDKAREELNNSLNLTNSFNSNSNNNTRAAQGSYSAEVQHVYNDNRNAVPSEFRDGFGYGFNAGSRRNKATPKPKPTPKAKPKPKHEDMTMKDIKELCKANLIKLSKVVDNKRVVFNKKELITKLKRKKLL